MKEHDIIERFADNGDHSHYDLQDVGEKKFTFTVKFDSKDPTTKIEFHQYNSKGQKISEDSINIDDWYTKTNKIIETKLQEVDYVVKKNCSNAMIILKRYTDRALMLKENPTVDKGKWIVIETETEFARYNEINGNEMKWMPSH